MKNEFYVKCSPAEVVCF